MHLKFKIKKIDETIDGKWSPTEAELYISEVIEIVDDHEMVNVTRILTQDVSDEDEFGKWIKTTDKYYTIEQTNAVLVGFKREPNMSLLKALFAAANYEILDDIPKNEEDVF